MSDTLNEASQGQSNSTSSSNSPNKAAGTLKSRIAAFESGAAANASKSSAEKAIPHADLSNLRSRFDRAGDKPLIVKGSFGLGAPPPSSGISPGESNRAVSLGSGRAISPLQSPSVVIPPPPSTITGSRSLSSSARPQSLRSESTTSLASTTTTASSLLPGPLAALVHSSSSTASDESISGPGGLRTPMSSVSLSSMQVESGSVVGNSGDTTSNEDGDEVDELVSHVQTAGLDTPGLGAHDRTDGVEISAAQLEKSNHVESNVSGVNQSDVPETVTPEAVKPPEDAVQRAAEELERYTLEKPSQAAGAEVSSSTAEGSEKAVPDSSLPHLAVQDTGATASERIESTSHGSLPSLSSPTIRRSPSRPLSYSSARIRRSSTANSVASLNSRAESDVTDTKLEDYDVHNGQIESHTPAASKDLPRESHPGTLHAEAGELGSVSEALFEDAQAVIPNLDVSADDSNGMPVGKCSDCREEVPLLDLAEHECATSKSILPEVVSSVDAPTDIDHEPQEEQEILKSPPRGREAPIDVPTDDVSNSPLASPAPGPHLLAATEDHEKLDVPDDEALSTGTDSHIALQGHEDTGADEVEEDYMTALTSHRDSMDVTTATPLIGASSSGVLDSPSSTFPPSPAIVHTPGTEVKEDDETEELALPAVSAETTAKDTPRGAATASASTAPPDSPTPSKSPIIGVTSPMHTRKEAISGLNIVDVAVPRSTSPTHARSEAISSLNVVDVGSPRTDTHEGSPSRSGIQRRTSGRNSRSLDDTDSDTEGETGTATIIS